MISRKLIELLTQHICLIKYKKQQVLYYCFFTKNSKYIKNFVENDKNSFEAYNLITEEAELLDPSSIQAILCSNGSASDKIELSYNSSKQKIKKLKQNTSALLYKYIIGKLTNHQDLVFDNGLTLDDLLFITSLESRKPTLQNLQQLFSVNCHNLSRAKIMMSWFFDIEVGKSCNSAKITNSFVETLKDSILKEKKSIIKEWPLLTKKCPRLFNAELSNLLKTLDSTLESSISNVTNNSYHFSEVELITYLSSNFWPKNIQPNPFLHLH